MTDEQGTQELPGDGSPPTGGDQDTVLQKVACPSCSEVYEISIPRTGEERSITVCPFCDQKFFVRHEAVGEKSPEPEPAPTPIGPSSAPLPPTLPPPSPPAPPGPGPLRQAPGQKKRDTGRTGKPAPGKKAKPKREPSPPRSFGENPSVAGMKAASISFLKRLPVVIIPVFGLLYLFTLGIYDSTRNGARKFLEVSGGSRDGAFKLGMLFGFVFATIISLLVYIIFSLLTVSVFLALSEMMIFSLIFATSLFFSALGSRAALN